MRNRPIKRAMLILATTALSLVVVEIVASAMLFYNYKDSIPETNGQPASSILLLARRFINGGNAPSKNAEEIVTRCDPAPLYFFDSAQGYSMKPGTYTISFIKSDSLNTKPFSYKTTILNDGSRFVGNCRVMNTKDTPHVFVLGDSFVHGSGVNDEQTFSYHLQQSLPDRHVRLFATGGHSLSNAYINIQRLKSRLNENDVVILGYASFYDLRHVAAPSRLRQYGSKQSKSHRSPDIKQVKVDIDDAGKMTFGLVPFFCEDAGDYCNQKDPDRSYMQKVSARLINEIGRTTRAKVFLLYMRGEKSNPVLTSIDPSITIVPVQPDDFEYEVNDKIMDYDDHPGPYWHYAVHTKLMEAMKKHAESPR